MSKTMVCWFFPVFLCAAAMEISVPVVASPDSSLSVASGSVTVPVYGTGFTPSTTVTIDGVAIASTRFVSATEIDVTTGGSAELVRKHARVTDSDVDFDCFSFQPNDPVNFPEPTGYGPLVASVQPLFPLFASTGLNGSSGGFGGVI